MSTDARVSLLVHEQGTDVQAAARVTLIGNAERISDPSEVAQRYQRYFPATHGYREQLDFDFWRITPVTLRAIAGFAKAHWLSREAYAPPPQALHKLESDIVSYINANHTDTLRLYCKLKQVSDPDRFELVGVDCDGLDLRTGSTWLRLNFDEVVYDMPQVHAATSATAVRLRAP